MQTADLPPGLPPDVAAYLVAAAEYLMEVEGFVPESEAAARLWLEAHTQEVGECAQANMRDLWNKIYNRQDVLDEVCAHISAVTHTAINAARDPNAPRQFQPRYVAYCNSRGVDDPSKMFEIDGNSNVGYLCWRLTPTPP